jgi:hypothetical protein
MQTASHLHQFAALRVGPGAGLIAWSCLWSCVMSRAPSIIPPETSDQDVYLVLDDFGGRLGRAWRETDENATDREALIRDLVEGEFNNPIRIITFNTSEGWSRDVTVDIADELRRRLVEYGEIAQSAKQFLEANRR